MKAITVEELRDLCNEQITRGNGNKTIMVLGDDEGNTYHYLWYTFTEVTKVVPRSEIDENVAKYEDTIILG